MNLFDLFATPQDCEVVLLSEFPVNADPARFSRVTWPNYQKIITTLVMDMVPGQGGLIFVNVPFEVTQGSYTAVAYAIVKDGICLFVGQLDPSMATEINAGQNVLQARTIVFISRFPA